MQAPEIMRNTVLRTYNTADDFGTQDLLHATIGLVGEVGELSDSIKRNLFYGQEFDRENIIEELGDIFYYLTALLICYGTDLDEVTYENGKKLAQRYPQGFTKEASIQRADKN